MREKDQENEDFVLEETANGEGEADDIEVSEEVTKDKLRSLKSKLRLCEAERRGFQEDLLRARADFLNSKRRLEEDATRNAERATEKMLYALLPVIDSFEMAMRERESQTEHTKGLEAVYGQFQSLLKSYGVEEIDASGKAFDPSLHEAVSNRETNEEHAVDTVLEVLQKGYRKGSTVIRPARVVVGIAREQ